MQQIIVITGASAGVGRATALRFAREGARLGLIARDRRALDEIAEEVRQAGGDAVCHAVDVSDAAAVQAAAQATEEAFGAIEVWINCAMATVFSPFTSMGLDEFRRVTEVTYLGYVHGTMAALKLMVPRDRGTILQVGSALAYRAIPLQSAYCGAKFAIRGFTDSVRSELIHDGSAVRLVMVQLPAVNTPQFDWGRTHMEKEPRPVGPVFQPEAIAERIFEAVRHPRREYWIGASAVKAILGTWLLPSYADRLLARQAYDGQERPTPVAPNRPDNLFEPVAELHSTRGSFSHEADETVAQVSGETARWLAVGAVALVSAGIGAAIAASLSGERRARLK